MIVLHNWVLVGNPRWQDAVVAIAGTTLMFPFIDWGLGGWSHPSPEMEKRAKEFLELLEASGYDVNFEDKEVTAVNEATGARFVVPRKGVRIEEAVIELAQQVGIDLEDG